MKILYDHQMSSRQLYGGVSRYFYEISSRIAATKETQVEIFAPLYVNAYLQNSGDFNLRGAKVPYLKPMSYPIKLFNTILSRIMLSPRRDVDVFHETYYSMADCCPRSAMRVITVFDMIHEKFPESFSRWDRTREAKAYAVHRADHVICISENTRRDLVEILRVPLDKTSVVKLGYSLLPVQSSAQTTAPPRPYILYVGGRVGYKNFERLLMVYAQSSALKNEFLLICFGGGGFTAQELSLLKSLDIAANTVMQLAGNDDVLANLYSSAAAFVFPSLYEGFGIPPLEAMSFGCPVACSNTSSLPEVVGDAAELFDPTDEVNMLTAIERIVFSPQRTAELIADGYDRIKQFSWDLCARATLDVYNQLLRH